MSFLYDNNQVHIWTDIYAKNHENRSGNSRVRRAQRWFGQLRLIDIEIWLMVVGGAAAADIEVQLDDFRRKEKGVLDGARITASAMAT